MRQLYAFVCVTAAAGAIAALPPARVDSAPRPTFLYVHDYGTTNQVWGYQMATNGALTPVAGNPFNASNPGSDCGGQCQTLNFVPGRKMLLAPGADGISVFRVGVDGSLTLVTGSPFGSGTMTGTGFVTKGPHTYVYVSRYYTNDIAGFELESDGTLSTLPSSPYAVGANTGPDGLTAYKDVVVAATERTGGVASFKVQSDGSLHAGPGSPVDLNTTFNYNLNVDSTGHYVYTADGNAAQVFGLKLNRATGSLTQLPNSPFGANLMSSLDAGMAVGKSTVLFAFSSASSGPNIQAYKKSGNGRLTALGSAQDIGFGRIDVGAFNPTGKILALAGDSPDKVATYGVNARTGMLTLLSSRSETFGNVNGMVFAQP